MWVTDYFYGANEFFEVLISAVSTNKQRTVQQIALTASRSLIWGKVSRREESLRILQVQLEFARLGRFRRVEWLIWKSNTMFGEDEKNRERTEKDKQTVLRML